MTEEQIEIGLLWDKALSWLKKRTDPKGEGWFKVIVPLRLEDENKVVLGVSDDFFASWLEENCKDVLLEALSSVDGKHYDIAFECGHIRTTDSCNGNKGASSATSSPPQPASAPTVKEKRQAINSPDEAKADSLYSLSCCSSVMASHTFENFVVGEPNRYAFTVAQTAAFNPGYYNPLYIYGSTGTGKTHLLHAVANSTKNSNPHSKVIYITCEEFLNSYINSLQNHNHDKFRNFIRSADMLLVDDVHMLAGKTQLQEEFFNTFNSLYHQEKQIILTSDKQPFEIKGLEERLVSRFESGVTSEITPPDLETRLAILKMMQKDQLIKINDEVLLFVASRISKSIRRLKGALIQLVAYASVMKEQEVTVEIAENLLRRQIDEESSRKIITIESIQKAVAEYFNIRISDILGKRRQKHIAEPRMVAMYLSRELTSHSYTDIGRAFDRNHATIMNALTRVTELCNKDEKIRRAISKLQQQLAGR